MMTLIEWADAPRPPFLDPQVIARHKSWLKKALATETAALTTEEQKRVASRVLDWGFLFLRSAMTAQMPPSMCAAFADALAVDRGWAPLLRLFLARALGQATLEDVSAFCRTVFALRSRLRDLLAKRDALPRSPALVAAARDASHAFVPPRYMPAIDNQDASVLVLLALDGSPESAAAFVRVVEVMDGAPPGDGGHRAVALVIAEHVGSEAFFEHARSLA